MAVAIVIVITVSAKRQEIDEAKTPPSGGCIYFCKLGGDAYATEAPGRD